MSTILVDIKESELINFIQVNQVKGLNQEGNKKLFESFPFTLYRQRMMGGHIITIQIPLIDYCLYLESGLVK